MDRLHVALPHSASRQQLFQDVNLTPIENLPAVLDGWAAAAERLESARPLIEAARAHEGARCAARRAGDPGRHDGDP